MPGRTEKGIPSPLPHSPPPNTTAHSSYESGLQCPSLVPVPNPSLPCYVTEQSHDLIMVSVDTSCTVTGVQGADACRRGLAPKHSVTTKDTFSLTPALLPFRLRENMQSEPSGSVLFSQAPSPNLCRGRQGSSNPSPQCLGDWWAVGRERKQRSWLPRATGPCRYALCPPREERPQWEDFTWKLWDWCFSTCAVRPAQESS